MGGCRHLHVVLVRGLQDHVPKVALNGVVDPVLRFVDNQEAVAAVGEGEPGGEEPRDAVTEALQGDGARMIPEFHVRSRTKLYAGAAKVTIQSTSAPARCRSFRSPPTVFSQPKTCSTSFRFRWLTS